MISQSSCDRSPPHDHDKWRARKMDARYCPLSVCRLQVVYLMTTPTPRRDATGRDSVLDIGLLSPILIGGLHEACPRRRGGAVGRGGRTVLADVSRPRPDDLLLRRIMRIARVRVMMTITARGHRVSQRSSGVTSTFACCRTQFVGPITAPPGEILHQVHC